MKRLRVILVFLLLGAIVNVAVAWGCALLMPMPSGDTWITDVQPWGEEYPESWYYFPDDPGASAWSYGDFESKIGFGWARLIFSYSGERGHNGADAQIRRLGEDRLPRQLYPFDLNENETWLDSVTVFECGWPLTSLVGLYYEIYSEEAIQQIQPGSEFPIAVKLYYWPIGIRSDVYPKHATIPYLPIWQGFTINTFFYSTLLWLMISGSFVLRRIFRHNRGLCVKCAYDLQGADHQACPECGEEIRKANPA